MYRRILQSDLVPETEADIVTYFAEAYIDGSLQSTVQKLLY